MGGWGNEESFSDYIVLYGPWMGGADECIEI